MAGALPPSALFSSFGVRLPLRLCAAPPVLPVRACATTGSRGCLPDCRGQACGRGCCISARTTLARALTQGRKAGHTEPRGPTEAAGRQAERPAREARTPRPCRTSPLLSSSLSTSSACSSTDSSPCKSFPQQAAARSTPWLGRFAPQLPAGRATQPIASAWQLHASRALDPRPAHQQRPVRPVVLHWPLGGPAAVHGVEDKGHGVPGHHHVHGVVLARHHDAQRHCCHAHPAHNLRRRRRRREERTARWHSGVPCLRCSSRDPLSAALGARPKGQVAPGPQPGAGRVAGRTFMNSSEPYSVKVRQPTSTKVVCEEKMRSPQPCVACGPAGGGQRGSLSCPGPAPPR